MPSSSLVTAAPAPETGLERLAAAASHASLVLAMPFLLPLLVLVLYPLLGPPSPYVREQSIQALLFHLLITVVGGGLLGLGGLLASTIIGLPLALPCWLVGGGVTLWGWVISLIATIKACQGVPYRMPVVGGRQRA